MCRKLKVKNESLSTEDQITEVKHDIPVPNWSSLSGGSVMMDSHSLEAGSICLNSFMKDEENEEENVVTIPTHLNKQQRKQYIKEREAQKQDEKNKMREESVLYGVAANMLDLKTGGSRCMGVGWQL